MRISPNKSQRKNTIARQRLADFADKIIEIKADFICFGRTTTASIGKIQTTILLKNIRLASTGEYICEHIWVKLNEICNQEAIIPNLINGSRITLTGTPYAYYNEFHRKIHGVKYSLGNLHVNNIVRPLSIPA